MATAAVTYTFTSGTTIVSNEVDQNNADLVTFLNDQTVHKDGSKVMTGALTLPTAEPSGSDVAVRRKSAYRACAAAHPDITTWTVAGGGATSYTTMTGDGNNNFGFVPDYAYTLVVLVTGTVYNAGAAGVVYVAIDAPSGTPISIFGPDTDNHWKSTAAINNEYVAIAHSGRANFAASTTPDYVVRYKVSGFTTASFWITAFSWILPQTRQSPT